MANSFEYTDLLKIIIDEEHFFIKEHQTRINFYTGFITTIIVASFAGFIKATEYYHFFALLTGPALNIAVSIIAIRGTSALYKRFLEAITVRAKIEQEIKLTNRSLFNNFHKEYWITESIVPQRYLESRNQYDSSEDFIESESKKGYSLWTTLLFILLIIINLLIFTSFAYSGYESLCSEFNQCSQLID